MESQLPATRLVRVSPHSPSAFGLNRVTVYGNVVRIKRNRYTDPMVKRLRPWAKTSARDEHLFSARTSRKLLFWSGGKLQAHFA